MGSATLAKLVVYGEIYSFDGLFDIRQGRIVTEAH